VLTGILVSVERRYYLAVPDHENKDAEVPVSRIPISKHLDPSAGWAHLAPASNVERSNQRKGILINDKHAQNSIPLRNSSIPISAGTGSASFRCSHHVHRSRYRSHKHSLACRRLTGTFIWDPQSGWNGRRAFLLGYTWPGQCPAGIWPTCSPKNSSFVLFVAWGQAFALLRSLPHVSRIAGLRYFLSCAESGFFQLPYFFALSPARNARAPTLFGCSVCRSRNPLLAFPGWIFGRIGVGA